MKMKKVTALLLTVAMAATMLAGCGSKEEKAEGKKEDGKTVLKFAAFEGGNGAEIWKNIEKAFEEEHKDVDAFLLSLIKICRKTLRTEMFQMLYITT